MQLEQSTTRSRGYERRPRRGRGHWLEAIFASDRSRFIALAAFMVLVAVTGGGSRSDIQSLIILRPAAVLFAGYALFVAASGQIRHVRAPLLIVATLMLLALLQLVPLPWAVWTRLPHREMVVEASLLVDMEGIARPLSLDPDRTWNTFFSLFVPFAAICLTAVQAPAWRRFVVPMLIGIGLLSATVALMQAIGGNSFQLYQISHGGFPTGLFANKNHQAVILLWVMLAVSWVAASTDFRSRSPNAVIGGAVALILLLVPLLILTGSRAGLLLVVPTLLLSGWLLLRSPAAGKVLQRAGKRAKLVIAGVAASFLLPLLFVFGVLLISGRRTALSRLFELDATADLRWQYMSIFPRMALDFMPFGSGFGSFEAVFNQYEPAGMLTSRYMNQVHNDLLQIAIEGGLPALSVLVVALFWLVRTIWRVGRLRPGGKNLAVFLSGSMVVWLAASLVDYPLRTGLAAALVATLTAWLSMLSTQGKSGPGSVEKPGTQGEEF